MATIRLPTTEEIGTIPEHLQVWLREGTPQQLRGLLELTETELVTIVKMARMSMLAAERAQLTLDLLTDLLIEQAPAQETWTPPED